jgi:hypothetical protein
MESISLSQTGSLRPLIVTVRCRHDGLRALLRQPPRRRSEHIYCHYYGGADRPDLRGLSGGPLTGPETAFRNAGG